MAAVTRWTEYSVSATTHMGISYDRGQRQHKDSTLLSDEDTFTMTSSNNILHLDLGDGDMSLSLASGTLLDPRLIAKDITEKIHAYNTADKYQLAQCEWGCLAGSNINGFRIWTAEIGTGATATVTSGVNTAHLTLGFPLGAGTGDSNNSFGSGSIYVGTYDVVTSGTWYGFWDETYLIMIGEDSTAAKNDGIVSITKGGSNTYGGTMTTGGIYSHSDHSGDSYEIVIDTTNGTTVGAGAGNVPRYKVLLHASDANPSDWVDILYSDYWYNVGTKGVKVKWTDAVFNTVNPAWTIAVESPQYAGGITTTLPPGLAKYTYTSNRGDDSGDSLTTTISGGYTAVGTRGLYVTFSGAGDLGAREVYTVMCRAPQPIPGQYGIVQLNYGNVTVSTESPVKTVAFEIMSGAYEISSVKFGLQADGSFSHHDQGDDDTYFRFGTVGPENNAIAGAATSSEWWPNVAATDIDSDTPPAYLYATAEDLAVVASADLSQGLGSQQTYLQADPIWLCIRLGANETGANSTINYRLYFDYS